MNGGSALLKYSTFIFSIIFQLAAYSYIIRLESEAELCLDLPGEGGADDFRDRPGEDGADDLGGGVTAGLFIVGVRDLLTLKR